jgi:hypothetical protein
MVNHSPTYFNGVKVGGTLLHTDFVVLCVKVFARGLSATCYTQKF